MMVMALPLSGCDTVDKSATVKVGLITKFPGDFYDLMVATAQRYDAMHPEVTVVYGQGKTGADDEGEIAIIESMIRQHVQAIAITPTSPNVQKALDKAVKAGIKIVLVDNDIPGWTGKSSVVATDNFAGGRLAGRWLADRLSPGATIGILQGRSGNPSLDDRVRGVKDGLGDSAKIVVELPTDCDETQGLNATQRILTDHPKITAIYGACGPPTLGALKAIKAAGKKPGSVTVVGFDASPQELTAITAGEQAGSVAQFPAKMGAVAIETAVDAVRGEAVLPKFDTGTLMVTKANVTQFN
jgi:simple sugar transport system substrate-binding protein